MQDATARTGKPMAYREDSEALLQQAGLNVMNHRIIPFHLSEDMRLPEDDMQNNLARWHRFMFADKRFKMIKALSVALFIHQLGWTEQQVGALCGDVLRELNAVNCPVFHNL